MIDVGLASEYGYQNPHIYTEAFGDNTSEPTLAQAAKLAMRYTDEFLPFYAITADPTKKAGNCADRAALDFSLLTAFPDFYPTIAVYENTEYHSIHFFNAVVDTTTLDTVVVDNSYRREKHGDPRRGTQQLISAAWAPLKSDLDIYAPIYKAVMEGALELYRNPTKTETVVTLGHITIPIDSDDLSLGFKDRHVPIDLIPDEKEAAEQSISILKPTIVTIFNNDESCRVADQILMNQ